MAATKTKPLDYQALLRSDPELAATLAGVTAQQGEQQSALSTARQQALIGYGQVPGAVSDPRLAGLLGGIGGDVTGGPTPELAREATATGLSTLGQLQRGYQAQTEGDNASLAARGLLHSGAFRQHAVADAEGLQEGEANAQSGLLASLGSLWNNYETQQGQNASSVANATGSALTRILGGINSGTIAAPTGTPGAPAGPSAGADPWQRPVTPQAPPSAGVAAPTAGADPWANRLSSAIVAKPRAAATAYRPAAGAAAGRGLY